MFRSLAFFMLILGLLLSLVSAQTENDIILAPDPLRPDIVVNDLLTIENRSVRIAKSPSEKYLYYMRDNGEIYQVDIDTASKSRIFTAADHGVSSPLGFAVSPDSAFYVAGNIRQGARTRGIIKRANPPDFTWTTLARTELYQLSNTAFDHLFNGIAISPDGSELFVNSGSRTDHGETQEFNGAFPDLREAPLTSAIFKLPIDGEDILLHNNEDSLLTTGYLYADGFRNSFDLAFAPNGDLFATENSGDRDDGDELNWIREGRHYGFPWRMGANDTPQQFPGFDPDTDLLINRGSLSYTSGFFYDDPTYPAPPAGIVFTDPVINLGPDSDRFRNPSDGSIQDASDLGVTHSTFTPHLSPLGLVFDTEGALIEEFNGDGFLLGWTDTGSNLFNPFGDPGESLFHLDLTKIPGEDRYEATITRLVTGFKNPIDAVMIGNKIYVLEFDFGSSAKIQEVTLPAVSTAIEERDNSPQQFVLHQNYPNPFNPATIIEFSIGQPGFVTLEIINNLGQAIEKIAAGYFSAGDHKVRWNAGALPGGVYYYRLHAASGFEVKKLILLK